MKDLGVRFVHWFVLGFVFCNILLFIETHLPALLLVLSTITGESDMSFLVMQNLFVEILIIMTFRLMKRKITFDMRFLFISNITVWLCFTVWYCQGNYYDVGISALPGSHLMRELYSMSNKLAEASHYILFTTIFLSIEYYIAIQLDKRFDLKVKLLSRFISISFIFCSVFFLFFGRTIESMLSNGPVAAYAEEYDMYIKAWQTGRESCEIEISRPGLKKSTLLHLNDEYGTILLLRHDSIGILPIVDGLGDDISIIQNGDFCVYDGSWDYRQDGNPDKFYGQVDIAINPLRIRVFKAYLREQR